MNRYDTPEVLQEAEAREALNLLGLQRLGYDLKNDQLLIENSEADYESLFGYKFFGDDSLAIEDVRQTEGAMAGLINALFVARSLVTETKKLAEDNPERLASFAQKVSLEMRQSFDAIYPQLLADEDTSDDMFWGFRMNIEEDGRPTFVTLGQCACLGYEPYGNTLGLPIEQLSFHNIDSQSDKQLGHAQIMSLTTGLATYSELLKLIK